jgi:hypothetical protein
MKDTIPISGVMLRRTGNDVVVEVEIGGLWVKVIREPYDGCFSHIVEPGGIRKAASEKADQQSMDDLRASGGIVEGPHDWDRIKQPRDGYNDNALRPW